MASSSAPSAPPPPLHSSRGDEEGDICPVCFEPFAVAGDHRPATLRCGHVFGSGCIRRWLKSQGKAAKCPKCNKKAKRSDVLLLYGVGSRPVDNSSLRRALEEEQSHRRRAELELQTVTDTCMDLRRQLQELKRQAGSGSSSQRPSLLPAGQSQYRFNKAVKVASQTGLCRVLAYCETLTCLLASQNCGSALLGHFFGVKKISVVNMNARPQYVPIHAKPIRGLAFSGQADSLMLSASLDNTVKLTSLTTDTVVQTYNAGQPVWSCCWSLDNNNQLYAGLLSGAVLIYDTRNTSRHVHQLSPHSRGGVSPPYRGAVASLCYVPRAASSGSFPCGGLIVGTEVGACFWEHVDGTTHKPHDLRLLETTSGCNGIQVDAESRHCLVTYRPGRSNPLQRSLLMELSRTPQRDAAHGEPGCCFWRPLRTFSAGPHCKLLTKNAVFSSPAGEGGATLVCVGDEASNSTMVWDAGSGALLQTLPADLPVLDIAPFMVNGGNYLASLTATTIKVHKWE